MSFADEVTKMAKEMRSGYRIDELLSAIRFCSGSGPEMADDLTMVAAKIATEAAGNRLNAAYGGHQTDFGAGESMHRLQLFMEGIICGMMHDVTTAGPYAPLLKQIKLEKDEEYQQYLVLKAKFGGK